MSIELSVIIVNYNGLRFLENCFDSLLENLSRINFEIIVLDNNSIDESCEYIKKNYPKIILIESKINYGFGVGNNKAVEQAKGNFLLLINNDTIVIDQLKPVLDIIKSDKSIGVAGINMLDRTKNYLQAGFSLPNFNNMLQLKKLLRTDKDFENGIFTKSSYDVGWLCGSFMMLSKNIYLEINGFDPDYFMYVEDVDFCKRIADKGYKRVFLSNFNYIHYVGFNNSKRPLLIKGYEIYISKHFLGFEKAKMLFAIGINKIVKKIKKVLKLD